MNDDLTLLASDLGATKAGNEPSSSHVLVLSEGTADERRIPIGLAPSLIGRTPPCNIVLPGSSVSRQHCKVQLAGNQVQVTDLGSTNGTFVDGQRVSGTIQLHHGAVLQVGTYVLTYHRKTAKEADEALALDRDLQGASAYVNMLLPKPILTGPISANWLYLPCTKLSGNAFGYRFTDPSHFTGFILDVAGTGIEAAMHAVAVLNLLRQQTVPDVDFSDPSSTLAKLNRTFQREHCNGLFFSIFYFAYDLNAGTLSYAAAGSHFAIAENDQTASSTILVGNDPPIGLEPDHAFVTQRREILPGSKLILMSDCACEAAEQQGMRHSPDRILSLKTVDTAAHIPEPLQIYNTIRQAISPDDLDGDFSAIVFDFAGRALMAA